MDELLAKIREKNLKNIYGINPSTLQWCCPIFLHKRFKKGVILVKMDSYDVFQEKNLIWEKVPIYYLEKRDLK